MKRPTFEEAQAHAHHVEETVITHTTSADKDSVDARVIIVWRDDSGNEWEYNDVRRFKLKWRRNDQM